MREVQSVQQGNSVNTTKMHEQTNMIAYEGNKSIFAQGDEYCQEPVRVRDSNSTMYRDSLRSIASKYLETYNNDQEEESNPIATFLNATNPVYVACDAISENRGVSETIVDIFHSLVATLIPTHGVYRYLTSD